MILKKYGKFPMTFLPDPGEVIYARRSTIRPWTKAAMVRAGQRGKDGLARIQIQWLEDNPEAGTEKSPVRKFGLEWLTLPPEGHPPLILQIRRDAPGDGPTRPSSD